MRYKLGQTVYFRGRDPYVLVALITDLDDLNEYSGESYKGGTEYIGPFRSKFESYIKSEGHKGLYLLKNQTAPNHRGSSNVYDYKLVTDDLITLNRIKDRSGNLIKIESPFLIKYKKFREFIYKEYARDSLITFLIAVSWGFVLMIAFGSPDEHISDIILFSALTLLALPSILRFLSGAVLFMSEMTYAKFYSMDRLLGKDMETGNYLVIALSAIWLITMVSCLIAFVTASDIPEGFDRFLFSTRSIIIDVIALYYIGAIPFIVKTIFRIEDKSE